MDTTLYSCARILNVITSIIYLLILIFRKLFEFRFERQQSVTDRFVTVSNMHPKITSYILSRCIESSHTLYRLVRQFVLQQSFFNTDCFLLSCISR